TATPHPLRPVREELRTLSLEQCVAWDLREQVSELLRVPRDRLVGSENLASFGFDSLGLAKWARVLNECYGLALSPAGFFSHPSLDRLVGHLLAAHRGTLEEHYSNLKPAEAEPKSQERELPRPQQQHRDTRDEKIAIIGMSGRFPAARTVEEFWNLLVEGR